MHIFTHQIKETDFTYIKLASRSILYKLKDRKNVIYGRNFLFVNKTTFPILIWLYPRKEALKRTLIANGKKHVKTAMRNYFTTI